MGIKEDFLYCEEVIRKNSASFYKAFSKLPRDKALCVYAVYAFCREADDIVDVKHDIVALEVFKKEFLDFKNGITPDKAMWRALKEVFNRYEMNLLPYEQMLEGQFMDLAFKQPETQEQLEEYCYYVAGTVGLMITPILSKQHKKLEQISIKLGKAMQITNILRDIGEDYANGRIYLPKQVMEQYGCNLQQLVDRQPSDNFIALWEYEAKIAETYYKEVLQDMKYFDEDSILPVLLSLSFYRELLFEIRRNGYSCLYTRNYISKLRKIGLYFKSKKTKKLLTS